MKSFTAWLIQLIALTAASAALCQEQHELRATVTPVEGGCDAGWCAIDTSQVPADTVAPADWYAFRLIPVIRDDHLVIQQESSLNESTEFTRTNFYPQIDEDRSWAQDLARIKEIRLITLWQSPDSKIFLGVNNDGFAGLNYSQTIRRKPKQIAGQLYGPASRIIGPRSPPLVHAQSLTYEKRDLSGELEAGSK